jgi:DNA-binding response OmpR family regulator
MNNKLLVYVLEDDKMLGEQLQLELKKHGFATEIASTEKECRALLDRPSKPSAIIVDIMIPVERMTREALEALQEDDIKPAASTGLRLIRDIREGKYDELISVPLFVYTILENNEIKALESKFRIKCFLKDRVSIEDLVDSLERLIAP